MTDLRDKVVWITGAGRGIGKALALEMARHGARIALTARSIDELEAVGDEIRRAGGNALVVSGDVQDLAAMEETVARIEQEWQRLDILVANAGNHIPTCPTEFDSAEYAGLMDLNYGGMLTCIDAVVPGMLARGHGHIVGMASLAGFRGLPTAAAYGASKAAMQHFLESVRFQLEPRGIFVTILCPGFVRTPLTDKNDFYMPFLMEPDKAAARICRAIRRRRKEYSFPFLFSTGFKIMRALPYPLYEFIIKRLWNGER